MLRLRWHAAPRLVVLAAALLLPALLVWAAALAQSLGIGQPLSVIPVPAAAPTRIERAALLGLAWTVTLGLPLLAALVGVLALVDAELDVVGWEITGRLRLPRPPWRGAVALAVVPVGLGALLFAAMAGHMLADCVLGGDC